MLKNNKRIILFLLVLAIVLNFSFKVYEYRSDIFKKFDAKYWEERYQQSQWANSGKGCNVYDPHINPKTCVWDDNWYMLHKNEKFTPTKINPIGDDGLYIYAGYLYAKGLNPAMLNAEIPPLGKYLIGFFEIYSGYLGIFSLFFSALTLVFFYLLNSSIFKSKTVALIPVLLFSLDRLFIEQIRAPFLDTMLTASLFLSLFLLVKKKYLGGILAGVFMATKSPFLGVLLFVAYFIYLFISKEFSVKKYISFLALAVATYVLSYFKLIISQGPIYFLKVQKYIVSFYGSGAKPIIGAVFPVILFGYWSTWWGPQTRVIEWSPFWAVALILSSYAIYSILRRKTGGGLLLISLWIMVYIVFLIFTPLFPRYLLLLLPFMYNLAVWILFEGTGWTSQFRL